MIIFVNLWQSILITSPAQMPAWPSLQHLEVFGLPLLTVVGYAVVLLVHHHSMCVKEAGSKHSCTKHVELDVTLGMLQALKYRKCTKLYLELACGNDTAFDQKWNKVWYHHYYTTPKAFHFTDIKKFLHNYTNGKYNWNFDGKFKWELWWEV